MSTAFKSSINSTVDSAFIAAIAQTVIARLNAGKLGTSATDPENAISIDERVVSAESIHALGDQTKEIRIATGAIVTPAAKDELRLRGISIRTASTTANPNSPSDIRNNKTHSLAIFDRKNPDRLGAISSQLMRRGVSNLSGATIHLSDAPAAELIAQCTAGHSAVMIRKFTDIDRFAAETGATVFVFDMLELNLVAAVNAAIRIAKLGEPKR